MTDDDFGAGSEDDNLPEILISVSQSISLQKRVAAGEFSSLDEAIAKSSEELQLTKVGENQYSVEAIERLKEGCGQADAGNLVPQEEIEAFFADWRDEINQHPNN
jgi:predicted transcriptional regulator